MKRKSKGKWKEAASEYFEMTTIGALPQAYFSHYVILKLIWLLIFIFGSTLTIFHTYNIVDNYLGYPIKVQVFMKTNESLEFPAVTVCNLNPVKKSKIRCTKYRALAEIQEKYKRLSVFKKFGYDLISEVMDVVNDYNDCNNQNETSAQNGDSVGTGGKRNSKKRRKRQVDSTATPEYEEYGGTDYEIEETEDTTVVQATVTATQKLDAATVMHTNSVFAETTSPATESTNGTDIPMTTTQGVSEQQPGTNSSTDYSGYEGKQFSFYSTAQSTEKLWTTTHRIQDYEYTSEEENDRTEGTNSESVTSISEGDHTFPTTVSSVTLMTVEQSYGASSDMSAMNETVETTYTAQSTGMVAEITTVMIAGTTKNDFFSYTDEESDPTQLGPTQLTESATITSISEQPTTTLAVHVTTESHIYTEEYTDVATSELTREVTEPTDYNNYGQEKTDHSSLSTDDTYSQQRTFEQSDSAPAITSEHTEIFTTKRRKSITVTSISELLTTPLVDHQTSESHIYPDEQTDFDTSGINDEFTEPTDYNDFGQENTDYHSLSTVDAYSQHETLKQSVSVPAATSEQTESFTIGTQKPTDEPTFLIPTADNTDYDFYDGRSDSESNPQRSTAPSRGEIAHSSSTGEDYNYPSVETVSISTLPRKARRTKQPQQSSTMIPGTTDYNYNYDETQTDNHLEEETQSFTSTKPSEKVPGYSEHIKSSATDDYSYAGDDDDDDETEILSSSIDPGIQVTGYTEHTGVISSYATDDYSYSGDGYGSTSGYTNGGGGDDDVGGGAAGDDDYYEEAEWCDDGDCSENEEDHDDGYGYSEDMDEDLRDVHESLEDSEHLTEELALYSWLNNINDTSDKFAFSKFLKTSKLMDFKDVMELATFTRNDFQKFGYSFDEFIVECTIDRSKCNSSWFNKFTSNKYGNCYTFNKKKDNAERKLHIARRAGSQYGLRLTLNINYSEYVGLLAPEYGIRVSIHPADTMAVPEDHGFDASPGVKTSVAVERSEVQRLKSPYTTNCTTEFPKEYIPYVNKTTKYSLELCKMGCKDSFLHQKCGCVSKIQNAENNTVNLKACNIFNATQRVCRLLVESMFYLPSTSKKALKCYCQPICNEVMYRPLISHTRWPSKSYQQMKILNFPKKHNISDMFLKSLIVKGDKGDDLSESDFQQSAIDDNLVRLHVYYETLTYQLIAESPLYPMSQLWADFGGVLGLYLGMTAASAIEVFQVLFLICYNCFTNRRRRNVSAEEYAPDGIYEDKNVTAPQPYIA